MGLAAPAAWTSVGKKFISGLTGLVLVGFLIGHLTGNLLLFAGPGAFNEYAHFLEHAVHGWALYAAEAGLLVFFVFHLFSGISVALKRRRTRITPYYMAGDAGGTSRKTISSRSMILTGLVLLVFIVFHIRMFKFGDAPLVARAGGGEMRDLYALVVFAFTNPWITLCYSVVMVLLGLHLIHGVWSAFQSLGVNHPRLSPVLYAGGIALAVLLAIGFMLPPLIILLFFDSPPIGAGH